MKTIEKNIYLLCEEIDILKEEVEYWKTKYEEERTSYNGLLNKNLESSKKEIANALMFALSVTDDENGNLVINKENRKILSENYKP